MFTLETNLISIYLLLKRDGLVYSSHRATSPHNPPQRKKRGTKQLPPHGAVPDMTEDPPNRDGDSSHPTTKKRRFCFWRK